MNIPKLDDVIIKISPVKLVIKINKIFNDTAGFPKNFIKAHTNDEGDFCLRIGHRDMQLKANGDFIGCGTDLELLKKYTITEK